MGKYFRTIYLCVVSFITLVMVVVGIISAVGSLVAYKYPVVNSYYYNYEYSNSNLTYLERLELEQEYKSEIEARELREKRASIKELFTSLAAVGCGAPLYVFHSKQLKKESEQEA